MEKEKFNYISSLDLLRGLAAIAVCFFHFTHGNPDFLSKSNVLYDFGRYGFLGVDLFFVISGFVIPYAMYIGKYKFNKFGFFLLKRVTRIEPPYLISIFMILVLNWFSSLMPFYRGLPFHIEPLSLALHLGYLNAFFHYPWVNDVYWTLAIEFQYYILIAMVFPLIIHPKKYVSMITLSTFAALGFLITDHNFIFTHSLLFIAGISLFLFRINYFTKSDFGTILLIAFILIFYKFDKRYLVAAFLPYFFITYFDFSGKISKFLGNISYSIYLIHIPIGGKIINICETFFQNQEIRSLFVFIALAVSIFTSWIFFKLIEKPFMQLSKKITYSKTKD